MTYKDIINKISLLRTSKNISAYDLSLMLGHNQTYFYKVEKGLIKIDLETFLEILTILGVSTFEFFCPDVYQDANNIKLFKELNDKEVDAVLTLLKIRHK